LRVVAVTAWLVEFEQPPLTSSRTAVLLDHYEGYNPSLEDAKFEIFVFSSFSDPINNSK
jgi:hypothetical protein